MFLPTTVGFLPDGTVFIEVSNFPNLRPMALDQLPDHRLGPVKALRNWGWTSPGPLAIEACCRLERRVT